MTVDEFLKHLGGETEERLELIDGVITAMVGGTLTASRLARNLLVALSGKLRGGSCEPFGDNTLLKATDLDAFSPDAMITCTPVDGRERYVTEPVVIFEVLSPSTESLDRGLKWLRYQHIPTLRHYVMIARDSLRVEIYSKEDHGRWVYEIREGDRGVGIVLAAVGVPLTLGEIYEGVEPRAPEPSSTVA